MSIISSEIGSQIRTIRKNHGMTLADLSKLIHKNVATVSKYEKGEITIDVETLYEIATALNVPIEQLLYHLPKQQIDNSSGGIPNFFSEVSSFYSYIFDGRNNSIIRCVFDIVSGNKNGSYEIKMYMNIKDYDNYQLCENTYTGYIKHYDAMTYISLTNQDTPMEEASVQILASYLDSDTKWGLFNGFSSRPMMPVAIKMLFSKNRLEEDLELKKQLKISKDDIRMLKLYNMLCVL
ncbi:MAG: helix-turn-helix transcriptional regulator [Clostridia bacterium]